MTEKLDTKERCLYCGNLIPVDRRQTHNSFCSDECEKELIAEMEADSDATYNAPVSWCCICGGLGFEDHKCWGCQ